MGRIKVGMVGSWWTDLYHPGVNRRELIEGDGKDSGTSHPEPVRVHDSLVKPIALLVCILASFSSGLAVMIEGAPLEEMIQGNALSDQLRHDLLVSTLLSGVATAMLLCLIGYWLNRSWLALVESTALLRVAKLAWPLTLLGFIPYFFKTSVWGIAPNFFYVLSVAVILSCACIAEVPRTLWIKIYLRFAEKRAIHLLFLFLLIALYCLTVSYLTIQQHYALNTRAFDLGIFENVFWNSSQGDLFSSSIEAEGNHLGVHTSFIFLPFFLIYSIFPATETLLILQTVAIGLAAWPLFLLARSVFGNDLQALLISCIYLAHPAIAGANFYDFHELAFVPIFLFSIFYFLRVEKMIPFWVMVVLLLSVKEDMAIIVILIGIVVLMTGFRRRGVALIGLGLVAYVSLQEIVIPYFAAGQHDFSWYYLDMIPGGEGPIGLITTLIVNPLFAIKYAFSGQKILYVFQLMAPVGFLCFLNLRGCILLSYGLVLSLCASRPYLYELGFQYSLTIMACAFVGALIQLEKMSPKGKARALVFATLLAVITSFHYGMIYPRQNFKGGFRQVVFEITDTDRERYREVMEFVAEIPDDASVTASETLVPHVARRQRVETVRYAREKPGRSYDYYFLLLESAQMDLRWLPEVRGLKDYAVVKSGEYCVLLKRSSSNVESGEALVEDPRAAQ